MRNSLKVARWEIRKNLKNKSFLISLILTLVIFVVIFSIPLLANVFQDQPEPATVYIADEIGLWNDELQERLDETGAWEVVLAPDHEAVMAELEQEEDLFYIILSSQETLADGTVTVYTHANSDHDLVQSFRVLEQPLLQRQLQHYGLPPQATETLLRGMELDLVTVEAPTVPAKDPQAPSRDPLTRVIPAAFAGLILFSVVITGMMTFQSASQEKKEKVSEMILSSITPSQLMDGKIIGYFVLGMVQVAVWIAIALPLIYWRLDFNILSYLLVPETLLLLVFAGAGYLLFAALFVGLGATVEDMATSGNFQGIVFMIPWIPFMLAAPVISDPEGMIARIASFFPLTSPGIMLLRLAMIETWPWLEIVISLLLLFVGTWLLMKLAGKIFKTGMLMYGKNATPAEIWRWIRH